MNLTATLKRAPKSAYYVAGGLALGVVGIEVWKRRATDATSPADTSNDATVAGTPTGSSAAPSPVITPPVIVTPSDNTPDLSWLTGFIGTVGGSLDNAVSTIGQLAAGDQGLAQVAIGANSDIATAAIAAAGQAPAPASQVAPIIVQVPSPATTPSVGAPASGPAGYPYHSSRGWYKCEKNTGGNKKQYPWVHVYAPSSGGARIATTQCPS